jgi:hypothetical protein
MPTLISSGCSARAPRLRSTSRQIRPVTVVSQPRRSSMSRVPAGPAICRAVHLPDWVHRPRWTASGYIAVFMRASNAIYDVG